MVNFFHRAVQENSWSSSEHSVVFAFNQKFLLCPDYIGYIVIAGTRCLQLFIILYHRLIAFDDISCCCECWCLTVLYCTQCSELFFNNSRFLV